MITRGAGMFDVMNAIGLDASAVGNREFDKGWADLRDRIIGAPGSENAQWEYLGANVYAKGTQDPVLPEYAILTINGIRIGVIGAVTEETSALVSPGFTSGWWRRASFRYALRMASSPASRATPSTP